MSFCGRGSATGGTNDVISSLCDTDFALIDMGFSSTYQLYNEYTHPSNWNWSEVSIRGIKHDEDLNAGEVFLLTGQNQVTVGHLLEGAALFMNRTVVCNTRKIELDAPLHKHFKSPSISCLLTNKCSHGNVRNLGHSRQSLVWCRGGGVRRGPIRPYDYRGQDVSRHP